MKYLANIGWWVGRVPKAFGIKNAKRRKLKSCHSQSNDKARFISFVCPVQLLQMFLISVSLLVNVQVSLFIRQEL